MTETGNWRKAPVTKSQSHKEENLSVINHSDDVAEDMRIISLISTSYEVFRESKVKRVFFLPEHLPSLYPMFFNTADPNHTRNFERKNLQTRIEASYLYSWLAYITVYTNDLVDIVNDVRLIRNKDTKDGENKTDGVDQVISRLSNLHTSLRALYEMMSFRYSTLKGSHQNL